MKKIIALAASLSICMTTAGAVDYSDTNGHWAEDIIDQYSDRGIIVGFDGEFRPDDHITRGEFCVILDRLFEYEDTAENNFTDLGGGFYKESVLKASAAGVIAGYENKIRPDDDITREEAAVMLCRAYDIELESYDGESESVSEWAEDAVYTLMNNGVMSGDDIDELRASDSVT